MRRALLSLGAVSVALFLSWSQVHACGDKFLVVGRGVRYTRAHATAHPASILLYMNPKSRLPTVSKDVQLESTLRQAGHRVQVVENAAALDGALKSGKYDFVLADIDDSPSLEKEVRRGPGKPLLLPVLYKPTDAELATARKTYGCVVKTPSKGYLSSIDDAMELRLKGAKAQ